MPSVSEAIATRPTQSVAHSLDPIAPDEIFALNGAYAKDPNPHKVNLGVGVYRTDDGKPWPLPVVQKAEKQLLAENDIFRHEYSAIEGDVAFLEVARNLMFGFTENGSPESKGRIASVQTVAGTGANHIGALFLKTHAKPKHVWLSNPSWSNHMTIWELAGVDIKTYPYYDAANRSLDFNGMMATLEAEAEPGDVILLHACAHNPTGLDPDRDQWAAIADLCEKKRLFPFFDSAYQGFASGSADDDAWAVRYFFHNKSNMEICVAQSFSKNFGLYGQRTGAFHFVMTTSSPQVRECVVNNLCHFIRGEYSMGPRIGCTLVKKILNDPELAAEWHQDLKVMSSRIKNMRSALRDELVRLQTPGSWEHIVRQNGMFSYTGLTASQVQALREKYHVYLIASGRASVSGLSQNNVTYVAKAIDDVVRNVA
ncbi:hypothetical protein MPDQ_004620 [Monascus purpureus]|uniref:aspartate transaminase n=1 Tax=Monascus purpureus TaxID=5098 RepID=A0A507R3T4_MONPU|nr:hypothetical protein MPDQ_004620 [Monascus purpureus]BDD61550.1 hypothetical protein MAP00_006591 [Monascus purpureus]